MVGLVGLVDWTSSDELVHSLAFHQFQLCRDSFRRLFSKSFGLVCFPAAWSDCDGPDFARVPSQLSYYFLGELIWSSQLEFVSDIYRFCFLI